MEEALQIIVEHESGNFLSIYHAIFLEDVFAFFNCSIFLCNDSLLSSSSSDGQITSDAFIRLHRKICNLIALIVLD